MAGSTPEAAALKLTLFGPMQMTVEGHPLLRQRSRKALSLLALLALRHGRPVEREWLAATLWPDSDHQQSFASLRPVLSELRRMLGDHAELIQSPNRRTLRLALEGVSVDVADFDAAIARNTPLALKQAAALYRGALLEGSNEEWVAQERAVREQDCLRALGVLAQSALAVGDYETAAEYARRAIVVDPWRDTARRQLMEALSRSGDTNAALDVYRDFTTLLRSDAHAVPDEKTNALYTRLRAQAKVRAHMPTETNTVIPVISGRLPHPLTELIGREDERADVAMRLRRSRLVTLTGSGGIGKTRLALVVAADIVREYPDGIWLVALESLSESSQVVPHIARTLGLREQPGPPLQNLIGHLRSKHLLLVLDNCEHLPEEVSRTVAQLLQECAGLRILATSRSSLGVTGETAWTVPALAAPDPAHLPQGQATLLRVLEGYDSVRLFVERAQSARRDFVLNGSNALAVAEACFQLGGVPLAIELTAARVKGTTVEQISERMHDQGGLLEGGSRTVTPRQQTLRATLDWSYDLLSSKERLLLQRLAVFAGGWTLEAAEQVCAGEGIETAEVPELLTTLIDQSLASFEDRDESSLARYRLLEMVRQYAAERLRASGAEGAIRTRHLEWCSGLTAENYISGPEAEQRMRNLGAEHDNVRAALAWCARNSRVGEAGLRLASALWPFWYTRGYCGEGRRLIQQALEHPETQSPTLLRARALHAMGSMSFELGDHKAARSEYEASLSIQRGLEKFQSLVSTLNSLGNVLNMQGEYEEARARFQEGLEIAQELGARRHVAWALNCMGQLYYSLGNLASARAFYEQGLHIRRELEDKHGVAFSLLNLANVLRDQGDCAWAREMLQESYGVCQDLGDKIGVAWSLLGMAHVAYEQEGFPYALRQYQKSLVLFQEQRSLVGVVESLEGAAAVTLAIGAPGKAARLWAAALTLRESIGAVLSPHDRAKQEVRSARARTLLGEAAFTVAWEEGRCWKWQKATSIVLEDAEAAILRD